MGKMGMVTVGNKEPSTSYSINFWNSVLQNVAFSEEQGALCVQTTGCCL